MNLEKELEKKGIIPQRELKLEERNFIAKNVADKLASNIKELEDSYNELYMRIFNCNMNYAEVDPKFKGVFYFYKNNTIYIDYRKSTANVDEYVIHECIHYLQNFSKITQKDNRAGLCQFMEFKILGLGINEAIVQYITAKALGYKVHRISNNNITIATNSENYYKYMTSLVNQILFLIGDKEAVKSCIHSTDDFENELYNTFEENTDKILKNFDSILEENDKVNRNENTIINIYMETQEIIYSTYFNKIYKRLTTIKEVDSEVNKLEEYEKILGKFLNKTSEDNTFIQFKSDMESKYFKKYIAINRESTKNSLSVIYKNAIYKLWNRIVEFIQRRVIKSKSN